MLLLKLFVFLVAELVFNGRLLCLAVCLEQGICKGGNLTVGVLQVFSYFIKSCYYFIKLLALVLVLLKQEHGGPLYLLIIHTFKGVCSFSGLSIISSRCLCLSVFSMSSSSSMFSNILCKDTHFQ